MIDIPVKTSVDVGLSVWLDLNGFNLYQEDPVELDDRLLAQFPVLDLVKQEVSMYSIPVGSYEVEDVARLQIEDDGIVKLRDNLQEAVDYLNQILND